MSDKESMILKAAKAELTTDQRLMFDQEYEKKKKENGSRCAVYLYRRVVRCRLDNRCVYYGEAGAFDE
jgi:hypothetical protein